MSAHVFRSRWRRLDAGPPVEGLVAVVHEVRLGDHLQAKRLVALAVDPDREPGWRGRVEEGDDPDGASIDAVETEQMASANRDRRNSGGRRPDLQPAAAGDGVTRGSTGAAPLLEASCKRP